MNNIIIKILSGLMTLDWGAISLFTILGLIGFIFYKKPKQSWVYRNNVELIIVSKASNNVKDALFENIKYHTSKFKELQINLLIDENAELKKELKWICKKNSIKLIIVPNRFKCKAIAKGRAIEYFIRNYVKRDKWYAFIDDDNKILDKHFLKEIGYYDKRGYKLANPILIPREGKSKISYVADHIRLFDDYFTFRLMTGLFKKPYNGVHGELLLAKGELLKDVTFNRETITEDFAFSRESIRKGVKTWQSRTKVSILSPHSISDFIKQRNRWYVGLKGDIKKAPLFMRMFVGTRLFYWKYGIVGSWVFFPLWFFISLPLPLMIFNSIGAGYYTIAYLLGVKKATKKPKHIFLILLIPLYAIIENISPWYKNKKKEFVVIDK